MWLDVIAAKNSDLIGTMFIMLEIKEVSICGVATQCQCIQYCEPAFRSFLSLTTVTLLHIINNITEMILITIVILMLLP